MPLYRMFIINQYCPYGFKTFIYGSIGAGFFVQNAMRSTTSGAKRYLVTCLSIYGLRTSTSPSFVTISLRSQPLFITNLQFFQNLSDIFIHADRLSHYFFVYYMWWRFLPPFYHFGGAFRPHFTILTALFATTF